MNTPAKSCPEDSTTPPTWKTRVRVPVANEEEWAQAMAGPHAGAIVDAYGFTVPSARTSNAAGRAGLTLFYDQVTRPVSPERAIWLFGLDPKDPGEYWIHERADGSFHVMVDRSEYESADLGVLEEILFEFAKQWHGEGGAS